ncbi:hypothetical protein BBP00_00003364 [Phytophthora kernoviae]|uniref:PH domain-containing protein n=1 Tax=Phytophthora kernoviae TaxID=325452 RepID=A0A3F2RUQ4_9STRA|nr:hypothetical protein BBP00_00003364 [Phytophthora kernoviae]
MMVTQRVTPINADAPGMKPTLGELDSSLLPVEAADARDDAQNDDTAPALGLAINTRNYQALLNNLARRRTNSGASSVGNSTTSPAYQRQTLAIGTMYHEQRQSPRVDEPIAQTVTGDEEYRTVVGLPVDTGNYEAIVGGGHTVRSEPTFNLLNRRATVSTMPQRTKEEKMNDLTPVESSQEDSLNSAGTGDDDAVMGLPISTGNYVAYLAGEQSSGLQQGTHRHRGYSHLAPEKAGSNIREPRVSDPYLSSSRRGQSSSNNGNHQGDRPSCFDNRRASNAAFVPHAGWVFIQRGAFKTWKRHYAVLSGLEFKYSKGVGHSPKGFGSLLAVQRIEDLVYGLLVEFGDGTTLQIRCPSQIDYDQWLQAMEKAVERSQNFNTQSKTSYTLTASEQHEGYLFKQEKNNTWKRCFFVVRIDGYIECRESDHGSADRKSSGYIKSVTFADSHANGLAIQLSTDVSMVCYADSYDEQMLWYGAIAAAANANGKTAQPKTSVKSSYVQTALSNHAGWLYKQAGIFKAWKRLYFTLHGLELAYAKDTNSEIVLCDKAHSVEEWDGHTNGLLIRLKSGRIWKVHAESYETAKRWRSVISSACRHADKFNLKKYLNSRRRKKLAPVYGGWLTEVEKGNRFRRFYVMDGTTLGVANDVDNQLERLGIVVDVGSTRDLECGMVFTLSNGSKIKVNCDSLADSRCCETHPREDDWRKCTADQQLKLECKARLKVFAMSCP